MNEEDNRAKSRAVDSLLNFETVDTDFYFTATKRKLHNICFCVGKEPLAGENSPGVSVTETAAADW